MKKVLSLIVLSILCLTNCLDAQIIVMKFTGTLNRIKQYPPSGDYTPPEVYRFDDSIYLGQEYESIVVFDSETPSYKGNTRTNFYSIITMVTFVGNYIFAPDSPSESTLYSSLEQYATSYSSRIRNSFIFMDRDFSIVQGEFVGEDGESYSAEEASIHGYMDSIHFQNSGVGWLGDEDHLKELSQWSYIPDNLDIISGYYSMKLHYSPPGNVAFSLSVGGYVDSAIYVPEPTTVALLGLSGLAIPRIKKRTLTSTT